MKVLIKFVPNSKMTKPESKTFLIKFFSNGRRDGKKSVIINQFLLREIIMICNVQVDFSNKFQPYFPLNSNEVANLVLT